MSLSRGERVRALVRGVEQLGQGFVHFVEELRGVASLGILVLRRGLRPPYRLRTFFGQLDFVGVGSTFIVALTGVFSGMVFAHQSSRAFELFDAESLVGPTVALTVTRQLAPVFTALMITMRAGSAMCTELGTMRVTEHPPLSDGQPMIRVVGLFKKYPADLSGGMRKRVGLARAIVLDPKIVLYDEPTTGLDPITTDSVDEMLLDAKRKLQVTSVVISHDVASAFKIADQIAFLSQGRIVERGAPEAFSVEELRYLRLRASLLIQPNEHLFATLGVDDMLNAQVRDIAGTHRLIAGRDFFLGAGVSFTDDDLKALITFLGVPTL